MSEICKQLFVCLKLLTVIYNISYTIFRSKWQFRFFFNVFPNRFPFTLLLLIILLPCRSFTITLPSNETGSLLIKKKNWS